MEIKKENFEKIGIDVSIKTLFKGENIVLSEQLELGILLLNGQITYKLNKEMGTLERINIFTESPSFIHISKCDELTINCETKTELLIIKTQNNKKFNPKIYHSNEIVETILDEHVFASKARRTIRDIVNYKKEPAANLVVGEVITDQGSWSSYPPHFHEQPEIYVYKFNHPNAFGVSIVGDNATIVKEDDITFIPGNEIHPQVVAPGYKMYYCWIIKNLEDNPWTDRIYDLKHKHLIEE